MPKIELFNKDEALQKAMNLFWEKGYLGTSLSDLTNRMDIGKGSFYNSFKNKRTLFEQCLTIYRNFSIHSLKEILHAEKDVKKGLKNFLIINMEYALSDPKQRGCFLTNTCTELAASDTEIAQTLNEHYASMKNIMADYLRNNSQIQDDVIGQVVNTIITFFIGMTVELKLGTTKKQLEPSIQQLLSSLF